VSESELTRRLTAGLTGDGSGHDRYLEHINSPSPLEIVLKGHLWIEGELAETILAFLPAPQHLDLPRLTFRNKVALAAAIGGVLDESVPPLLALNSLRNRLAHQLHHEVSPADERTLYDSLGGFQSAVTTDAPFPEPLRHAITTILYTVRSLRLLLDTDPGLLAEHLASVRAATRASVGRTQ
jgi:hypothetical protein